jgi:hypothetical protein
VRDRVVANFVILPTVDEIYNATGGNQSWVSVLLAAGLVTESWRPARGTYCIAADGHPCRSLFERAVDDYLTLAEIAHEVEPPCPKHAVFNPGRLRADWRLSDGTFVEAAGLMSDPAYAQKMRKKTNLASALGLSLIVITPDDLPFLDALIPKPT